MGEGGIWVGSDAPASDLPTGRTLTVFRPRAGARARTRLLEYESKIPENNLLCWKAGCCEEHVCEPCREQVRCVIAPCSSTTSCSRHSCTPATHKLDPHIQSHRFIGASAPRDLVQRVWFQLLPSFRALALLAVCISVMRKRMQAIRHPFARAS